MSNKLKILL